ncbi:MAG: hypothetical protein K2N03_06910 [Muribaculaceae bacterium]|nr:hypothetical protein [Muribaculaceae bacterium]
MKNKSAISVIFLFLLLIFGNSAMAKDESDFDKLVNVVLEIRELSGNKKGDVNPEILEDKIDVLEGMSIYDDKDISIPDNSKSDSRFIELWDNVLQASRDSLSDSQVRVERGDPLLSERFHIKKGKSLKKSFQASKNFSISAIPQAGGLVSMTIHAYNQKGYDEHFNDMDNFRKGESYRKKKIKLPSKPTTVDIEIFNRSSKDTTLILIHN